MTRDRRKVVLIGAGGFGRETAGLVASLVSVDAVGFLDDAPEMTGKSYAGLEVLGPLDTLSSLGDDVDVVITMANPRNPSIRRRISERLALPPERMASLIHPRATVGPGVEIGVGSVLHAGSVLTGGLRIGRHVAMMPNVVITHDDVVGDYVTFGAGVSLAGGVVVGDCAYLGAGACVREGVTIGAGAVVGMGAVVLSDVPEGETWAGVPARPLR